MSRTGEVSGTYLQSSSSCSGVAFDDRTQALARISESPALGPPSPMNRFRTEQNARLVAGERESMGTLLRRHVGVLELADLTRLSLPLQAGWADVIVSNGVVNLSPRKVRVLSAAFRVLRPGARLAIVDLVVGHHLPPEVKTYPAAWAGCLSGALSEIALYKGVRRAGFREVDIQELEPFDIAECELYPLFSQELLALLRDRLPVERHDRIAMSVLVRARKPAAGEELPARASRSRHGDLPSQRP